MAKFVNLTQHALTTEQVVDVTVNYGWTLCNEDRARVIEHITFDGIPSKDEMVARANALADVVGEATMAEDGETVYAMIGGAPYFQGTLERVLLECGITPIYSFTKRVVVETVLEDGTVEKKSVFKHDGWVGLE